MKKGLVLIFLFACLAGHSQGFYKRTIDHQQGIYLNDTTADTNHYSVLYAGIAVACKAYTIKVAGNALPKFVQDGWYFAPVLTTAISGVKLRSIRWRQNYWIYILLERG